MRWIGLGGKPVDIAENLGLGLPVRTVENMCLGLDDYSVFYVEIRGFFYLSNVSTRYFAFQHSYKEQQFTL